jgi:energy-coupling factor transport system ATP-binding protein
MIALEAVSYSYGTSTEPVLVDLNLQIQSSSWVTVAGPDGAGKSTLGKLLKGLLQPDSGSVRHQGPGMRGPEDVGYLGGDPYDSFVGVTVEEDVVFGLENLGLEREQIRARMEQALLLTGLQGMNDRLVETLSGGEQQKVALAGVLAMLPKVLLLDECLGMLDRPNRTAIRSLLISLKTSLHLTIVQISNDMEDIAAADQVIYLSSGRVAYAGTSSGFLSSRAGKGWRTLAGGMAALVTALEARGIPAEAVERVKKYGLINQ